MFRQQGEGDNMDVEVLCKVSGQFPNAHRFSPISICINNTPEEKPLGQSLSAHSARRPRQSCVLLGMICSDQNQFDHSLRLLIRRRGKWSFIHSGIRTEVVQRGMERGTRRRENDGLHLMLGERQITTHTLKSSFVSISDYLTRLIKFDESVVFVSVKKVDRIQITHVLLH